MNRNHLRLRKSLREIAFAIAMLGGLLVFFDWLVSPMLFSRHAVWPRLVVDVAGVALLVSSRAMFAGLRRVGRRQAINSSSIGSRDSTSAGPPEKPSRPPAK